MSTSSAALLALRAFRSSSLSGSNNGWTIRSRSYAAKPTSGGGTAGGAAASSGINAEGKNMDPPSHVFKQIDKSALGPGASKESNYKNPEYFSYHNMSYTDMEIVMAKHRVPQPSNNRK